MSAYLARFTDLPARIELRCVLCVEWMVAGSTSQALDTFRRHLEARHTISAANA